MTREQLEEIGQLLDSGQSNEARKKINKIVLKNIDRAHVVEFAHLCRRVGVSETGLKALKTYVRSQNNLIEAKSAEKAEYAHSLISIGGSEEALKLLGQCEPGPKVFLCSAFAHFSQWDYHSAIPFLENFLGATDPNSYQHLIGQVNFTAALVATDQMDRAAEVVKPLVPQFKKLGHKILTGNCQELLAQIYYRKKKWEICLGYLEESKKNLGNKMPDTLFVEKWFALINLARSPGHSSYEPLERVRQIAKDQHHWETLRDLDFNVGLICEDLEIFNRVYHGTPFPVWRSRAERLASWSPSHEYTRSFQSAGLGDVVVNMESLWEKGVGPLKFGSLDHKLLVNLAEDFYRPKRLPTLFEKLYPQEYFDPEYSSQKVKMLISRFRKKVAQIGLNVIEKSGTGYMLTASKKLNLLYRLEMEEKFSGQSDLRLLRIHELFGGVKFTSAEVSREFKVSQRSASRWLKDWEDEGIVIKIGLKKGSHYLIVDAEKKVA